MPKSLREMFTKQPAVEEVRTNNPREDIQLWKQVGYTDKQIIDKLKAKHKISDSEAFFNLYEKGGE